MSTLKLKVITNTRERVRRDYSSVHVFDGITPEGRLVHATIVDSNWIANFPLGSFLVIKRFKLTSPEENDEIFIIIRDPLVDLQYTAFYFLVIIFNLIVIFLYMVNI